MNLFKSQNISRLEIIIFGYMIGVRSFFQGDFIIGLKRIIQPVNYWRVTIFKYVADYLLVDLGRRRKIKILDIGSPKLLSLFLATKLSGEIYSTDLQDRAIFTEWKRHYEKMSNMADVIFEFANAKCLNYREKYFDVVYSLSTIHMITPEKDGDLTALCEIQKKIKHGGLLIVEVPFRNKYMVKYKNSDNFEEKYEGTPLFKERQYDDCALEHRLSNNVSGNLIKKIYLYEKFPFDHIWNKLPKFITTVFAFLEPWADMANICVAENEDQIKKAKSIILFFKIGE